ncbi:hypothetical protein AVEN_138452-1 [Araneus ventricosus]|uniref:Uncharacterized protein n=1 Tax=Araneus ventricosus TaxID=182803 RepID=A0A4Y2CD39_ARAVE|nr:hypothetical protein AVEN_138452-1 [Araneus ventricosus]
MNQVDELNMYRIRGGVNLSTYEYALDSSGYIARHYGLPLIKSPAAGESRSKRQNGYHAAQGKALVPRKQMNCSSSKTFPPRVPKSSVSSVTGNCFSSYGIFYLKQIALTPNTVIRENLRRSCVSYRLVVSTVLGRLILSRHWRWQRHLQYSAAADGPQYCCPFALPRLLGKYNYDTRGGAGIAEGPQFLCMGDVPLGGTASTRMRSRRISKWVLTSPEGRISPSDFPLPVIWHTSFGSVRADAVMAVRTPASALELLQ